LQGDGTTYTVIGRCQRSGRLGIGIATFSLAVGSYCPFVQPGQAAISTQAYVNQHLGVKAMHLLKQGCSPKQAVKEISGEDNYIDYRQVGIVDGKGDTAVFSGSHIRDWSGDISRQNLVAMGNALCGSEVVEAMADAFDSQPAHDLDERLLSSLEAGRDAGGQVGTNGHLAERSAVVCVYNQEIFPELDLRVDFHEQAVDELRRLHAIYKPYLSYHELRRLSPQQSPPREAWMRDNLDD